MPSRRNERFSSEKKDILINELGGNRLKNDLFMNKLAYSFQPLSLQPQGPPMSNIPQTLPKNLGSWPRGLVNAPASLSLGKAPLGDPLGGRDFLRPRNMELLSKFNRS